MTVQNPADVPVAKPSVMYALSVRWPWGELMFAESVDRKNVENRTRAFRYRGRLLIHQGLEVDPRFKKRDSEEFFEDNFGIRIFRAGARLGGFIGAVDLTAASNGDGLGRVGMSPWFEGTSIGHLLEQPWRCRFTPWKGQLGIFKVPTDLADQMSLTHREDASFVEADMYYPLPSGAYMKVKKPGEEVVPS